MMRLAPDFRAALKICIRLTLLGLGAAIGAEALLKFSTYLWRLEHAGWIAPTDWKHWIYSGAYILSFGYVLRETLHQHKETSLGLGSWRLPARNLIFPFVVSFTGLIIIKSELGNFVQYFWSMPEWLLNQDKELLSHPMIAALTVVVAGPLLEELFFRGVILRRLLLTGTTKRAILISSFLFAVAHLNPWQAASAFLGGLFLGWVYYRTRSLALCIAGHALNNATSIYISNLPVKIPGFNTENLPGLVSFQPLWFNLIGLGLLVMGIRGFHRVAPPAAPQPITSLKPEPLLLNPASG